MLPEAVTVVALNRPLPLKVKLLPVALPMLGVTRLAPVLTAMLPDINAVVSLSTKALNCVPISVRPALVLAVKVPPPENCANTMGVVPTVTGALVVHTNPESALIAPCSTKVNAPGISPLGAPLSKSVDLVNSNAVPAEPTVVTT